ncbi:MAG: hypothetical protein KatS3mg131_2606 [Candidatus Tectimicrobiota bacterium]|nr:MAG: hypothetical protein KatS3mg131_2606 [Candidatus Tectomicrobia bacterium]
MPSLFANLSAELPTLLASINSVLMRLDAALGEGGQIVGILQDIEGLITALNTTVSGVNTQSQQLLAQVQAP